MEKKIEQQINAMEILAQIGELISTGHDSVTIISVYKEAFKEERNIQLFKLRALLLKELEKAFESTNKSKATEKAFEDVYEALSHPNLLNNITHIKNKLTFAHISNLELALSIRDFKQDFESIDEISTLNDELKEVIEKEDITETQKIIIKQICYEIDEAVEEHVITGNSAVQKLHESLIGKFILYQEELKNIDSEKVKNTLSKVYTKIDTLNKAMNT